MSKPTAQKPSMAKTQSKKRKAPIDDVTSETDTPAPTVPAVKKPKQKKNRRPDAEDEESLLDLDRSINTIFSRMDPDLLADYVAANTKRFGIDLSSIELSDLYVPAGAVKDTTGFAEPRVKDNLAAFLEAFAGSEEDKKRLGTAPKKCGSPHTIVVAGAGLRAADLVRSTRTFQKKENVVAKLFAKHFKVAEQVEFLKKNRTGIAIGTPARLMALLDEGALSIEHLKRIVVDASHIDQKKRGVMDMKETMMPLAQWLTRKEFKERYGDSDKPLELLFF